MSDLTEKSYRVARTPQRVLWDRAELLHRHFILVRDELEALAEELMWGEMGLWYDGMSADDIAYELGQELNDMCLNIDEIGCELSRWTRRRLGPRGAGDGPRERD